MSTLTRNAVLLITLLFGFVPNGNGDESDFVQFFPDDAIPESVLQAFLASGKIAEYRIVTVDVDSLREMIRNPRATTNAGNPSISFPLLDESTVSVEIRAATEHHEGWQSGITQIIGKVTGDKFSMFQGVLAPDGSAHLTIRTDGQRYAIRKTSVLPYHFYYTLNWDAGPKKID